MAVLFVIYMPLEEDQEDEKTDSLDQVDEKKPDKESGSDVNSGKVGKDEGQVGLQGGENGEAKTRGEKPSIKIDEYSEGGQNTLGSRSVQALKMDSELRGVKSTSGIDSMVEGDQQEEDKPLLAAKKAEPASKSADFLLTGSQRNLADTKDENVNLSVGKFKVSKAPAGTGMDVLRPGANGSRKFSRDELMKEPIHDVTTEVITLQEALFEVLDELNIHNDVWEKNWDVNQWQIKFVIDSKECDHVLNRLTAFGIGRIAETSVSVFPASLHYSGKSEEDEETSEKTQYREKEEKRQKSEFIKSIKSRLTVAQVVGSVKSNAALTFDFLVLILLASMIAALGLAESSSVVLVASMLTSPLMGPIIGFTFGIVVKNPELWKLGVRNELIGLSICLTFGFLFGLFTGTINNTAARWGSSSSWPTLEMQARGMLRSLWVGVLIALPSGAGVALSILGGNTGSLVGVAISASLLPPAVNAGMLWGLALVSAISHPPLDPFSNSTLYSGVHPDCHPLYKNDYDFYYSCDMPTEAAILASVSLLLTILNIICIFLMGILVLKIKEIAPHRAMSPATAAFWKRDLAFARGTYQTIKGRACLDMAKMAKEVLSEFKKKNPDGLVESVIGKIQHDPSLYEVPEELPDKTIPEFLRQLSYEGHELNRQCQEQTAEIVQLGDHRYHTVGSAVAAKKFLKMSPSIPNAILDGCGDSEHRKGAVLRLRMNATGSTPQSPLSPTPKSASAADEVMMVDIHRFKAPRKVARKERLSARMSVDSYLSPPHHGRFRVNSVNNTIPETVATDFTRPQTDENHTSTTPV